MPGMLWPKGSSVAANEEGILHRTRTLAITALHIEAMDDLAKKDVNFFHNNFAGSLTKRALGYARRFEDVFDVGSFSIMGNLLPLVFVLVATWLVINTLVNKRVESVTGLVLIALGLPLYFYFRLRRGAPKTVEVTAD